MTEKQLQQARELIKKHSHLIWYSTNYDNLSATSITESVLNNGTWNDFQSLKTILGVHNMAAVFRQIISKRRVNLRPQTITYFINYFEKYAS